MRIYFLKVQAEFCVLNTTKTFFIRKPNKTTGQIEVSALSVGVKAYAVS